MRASTGACILSLLCCSGAIGGYELLVDDRLTETAGSVELPPAFSEYADSDFPANDFDPIFSSAVSGSTDPSFGSNRATGEASQFSWVNRFDSGFTFGGGTSASAELTLTDTAAVGSTTASSQIDITFAIDRAMRLNMSPVIHTASNAVSSIRLFAGPLKTDPLIYNQTDNSGPAFVKLDLSPGVYRFASSSEVPLSGSGVTFQSGLTNADVFATLGVVGDFDLNGTFTCEDLDLLVEAILTPGANPAFDLNEDIVIDFADVETWLTIAGVENNASGLPYLPGDANLDGTVDGLDFIEWNTNKFTADPSWCRGDFTADGIIDGRDFVAWNVHKFQSSNRSVPEPQGWLLLFGLLPTGFRQLCSRGRTC